MKANVEEKFNAARKKERKKKTNTKKLSTVINMPNLKFIFLKIKIDKSKNKKLYSNFDNYRAYESMYMSTHL